MMTKIYQNILILTGAGISAESGLATFRSANGLWNKSQHISEAEAKPGDLVFFEGTYDTPGKSHVGIVRPVRTIVEVEKGGCG